MISFGAKLSGAVEAGFRSEFAGLLQWFLGGKVRYEIAEKVV